MHQHFWPVPFIISPQNLEIDAIVSFAVSVLLAVMINAEAQAFVSAFLGDSRKDAKDRFHFNAFLHLDILGTICYVVAGFGWPKTLDIDPSKFKYPRLHYLLARSAGPVANLFLASIGGSLVLFMNMFSYNPRVFMMVIGVNITTAVFNLIPIPPMAMGYVVTELIPQTSERLRTMLMQIGPFVVLGLALLDRISHQAIFSPYFDPIIKAVYKYLAAG